QPGGRARSDFLGTGCLRLNRVSFALWSASCRPEQAGSLYHPFGGKRYEILRLGVFDAVGKEERPDSESGSGRSVRRLAQQLVRQIPLTIWFAQSNAADPSAGRRREQWRRQLLSQPHGSAQAGRLRLPAGLLRQAGIELFDQRGFVGALVRAREETIQALFIEPLPRRFLVSRIDRKEQGVVLLGRVKVPGCIANHQDPVRRIFGERGKA